MNTIIPAEFSDVATLCTAKEVTIVSQVVLGVDARALHEGLGVRGNFTTWAKRRIDSLGLEEGVDYEKSHILSLPKMESAKSRQQTATDYTLILDAAKHIAMVEKNEMGRLIRSYFTFLSHFDSSSFANNLFSITLLFSTISSTYSRSSLR